MTNWPSIGNVLGTSWERVGNKLGTRWERVGNSLGTRWERVGNTLGTRWERVGNPLGTRWEQVGNKLGTRWEQVGNVWIKGVTIGTNPLKVSGNQVSGVHLWGLPCLTVCLPRSHRCLISHTHLIPTLPGSLFKSFCTSLQWTMWLGGCIPPRPALRAS